MVWRTSKQILLFISNIRTKSKWLVSSRCIRRKEQDTNRTYGKIPPWENRKEHKHCPEYFPDIWTLKNCNLSLCSFFMNYSYKTTLYGNSVDHLWSMLTLSQKAIIYSISNATLFPHQRLCNENIWLLQKNFYVNTWNLNTSSIPLCYTWENEKSNNRIPKKSRVPPF